MTTLDLYRRGTSVRSGAGRPPQRQGTPSAARGATLGAQGRRRKTQDEDALPPAKTGARHFRTFHCTLRLRLQWRTGSDARTAL